MKFVLLEKINKEVVLIYWEKKSKTWKNKLWKVKLIKIILSKNKSKSLKLEEKVK